MFSRIIILLLGAGLMALAVLLYRPDALGMTPVSLGDYESYRLFLIVTAGWMGLVVFISAIVRRTRPKPVYEAKPERVVTLQPEGPAPSPQPLW